MRQTDVDHDSRESTGRGECERVGESGWPGLEFDEDIRFQKRLWHAQRVAWAVLLALTLAGILGLMGRGVLARAETGTPGMPLRLVYDRYVRREAPTTVRVRLAAGVGRDGAATVWFDRRYFDALDLDEVTPQPTQVQAGADRLSFRFSLPTPSDSTTLIFRFSPSRVGRQFGRVGLATGDAVAFTQFVLP